MSKACVLGTVAVMALSSGMLQSTSAFAQSVEESDVDAIIVTARRVEERLQDVPISITVYNQEQLANRNIANSADLAAYTPSLSVNRRTGSDKAQFAIRGFSQDPNTLPTVAVYFADVVAPRLQSNIGGGNGAGVGNMFDLQSVQVLKGPQGTLFGRNTTGGAILLVPQKPTDKLEGFVEGTLGNYDARRLQAVVNIPVGAAFKVRLGVDRNLRDGYIHNRSGVGPTDFSDVDYTAARLSILAELSPELENYTIATYAKSDTNGTVGKYAYCNRGTPAGSTGSAAPLRDATCAQVDRAITLGYGYYDVENVVPDPFVKSRTWQISNTTTWRASDTLTIKNIISYGEARERYSFTTNGDNGPISFVITYPGANRGQGSQSSMTEEFQLQGQAGDGRLVWQAGGYMELSDPIGSQEQYSLLLASCTDVYAFKCTPLLIGGTAAGNISVQKNNYTFRSYGAYGQATYKLTPKLSATGGIRQTWDSVSVSADNVRVTTSATGPTAYGSATSPYSCARAVTTAPRDASLLSNGACTRSFKTQSSRPTWLIGLDYKPTEDILVYAKYARGYRGGGVNEANVGLETWKPEKIDDYELGLKTSFHGAVSGIFNVGGFWNEFKDQQTQVAITGCTVVNPGCTRPGATGISGVQNVGKSRIKGVEADATLIYKNLRFEIGYAYLDAKVRGGSLPFCDSTSYNCAGAVFFKAGDILTFAPRNRVTLTGTYILPLESDVGQISVSGTFTHTDKQFSQHADDAAFAAKAIPYNAGISPATDLLNLNINWKNVGMLPIDLSVFATNVTKEKYHVGITSGLASTGGEAVILGEPRVYGIRLKYRFGT